MRAIEVLGLCWDVQTGVTQSNACEWMSRYLAAANNSLYWESTGNPSAGAEEHLGIKGHALSSLYVDVLMV